jgi:hypothetical protein
VKIPVDETDLDAERHSLPKIQLSIELEESAPQRDRIWDVSEITAGHERGRIDRYSKTKPDSQEIRADEPDLGRRRWTLPHDHYRPVVPLERHARRVYRRLLHHRAACVLAVRGAVVAVGAERSGWGHSNQYHRRHRDDEPRASSYEHGRAR